MNPLHLPKRFFGSLSNRDVPAADAAWVESNLLAGEIELWNRMSKADRRHAHAVGRRVVALLGDKATRPVIAAAVLHDVGKIEADAGTMLRVVSTFVATAASPSQIESWAGEDGWLGRAGRYLRHNETGSEMLRAVGSDELTVKWAREHELPASQWTLPEEISDALYEADSI